MSDFYEMNDVEFDEIQSYIGTGDFLDEDVEEIENNISSYGMVESEEMLEVDFGGNDDLAIEYYADMMVDEDIDNL